ncbi:MAG TPA: response regulator transcription factor [Bryobacteraceae bacterium]
MDSISIRVLSVDDHDLVRKGIAAILSVESDLQLVADASNSQDAIRLYRQHLPDVTLMDLRLPDRSGIETARLIRNEFPEAKIIALTSYDGDQDIYKALEAGVRGYLLKEMVHTEVVRAIRIVHSGKRYIPMEVSQQLSGFFPEVALTPREIEVLSLVARGLGNKEVGDRLGTAPGTVKAHVQSILSKLGAKDRTNAVTIALRRGIIHLHSPDLASSILNG